MKILAFSLNIELFNNTFSDIGSVDSNGGIFLFQVSRNANIYISNSTFANVYTFDKGTFLYLTAMTFTMTLEYITLDCK